MTNWLWNIFAVLGIGYCQVLGTMYVTQFLHRFYRYRTILSFMRQGVIRRIEWKSGAIDPTIAGEQHRLTVDFVHNGTTYHLPIIGDGGDKKKFKSDAYGDSISQFYRIERNLGGNYKDTAWILRRVAKSQKWFRVENRKKMWKEMLEYMPTYGISPESRPNEILGKLA